MAQAKIIETGSDVIMAMGEAISMPCPTPDHCPLAQLAGIVTYVSNLFLHFA
jgi:hypothetical protein